jgi:transposase
MLSFPPSPQVKVFVCRKPVDMRKSFTGLAGAVIDVVDHDPQSGHLFLFFNARRTMMKALVWEPSGYWVLAKRLATGRFQVFDRAGESSTRFEVTSSELALILDGIDLRGATRQKMREEVVRRLTAT